MKQIDDLKEGIAETIGDIAGATGLDKKTIKKLATTMYRHNYATIQEENRHFETLYETLVEGRIAVADDEEEEEDEQQAA